MFKTKPHYKYLSLVIATIAISIATVAYIKPAILYPFGNHNPLTVPHSYAMRSHNSFSTTLNQLETELHRRQIPIFAKFDHAANAQQVGLSLRPTTVLVFGSPQVGTLLMQENQSIALDLPLKLLVWEDAERNVWITLPRLASIIPQNSAHIQSLLPKLQTLLDDLATAASTPSSE